MRWFPMYKEVVECVIKQEIQNKKTQRGARVAIDKSQQRLVDAGQQYAARKHVKMNIKVEEVGKRDAHRRSTLGTATGKRDINLPTRLRRRL